jgi:hypothetical protein
LSSSFKKILIKLKKKNNSNQKLFKEINQANQIPLELLSQLKLKMFMTETNQRIKNHQKFQKVFKKKKLNMKMYKKRKNKKKKKKVKNLKNKKMIKKKSKK